MLRVDPMSSPPWQCDQPQIDLSLAEVRKADILPIESRARALELLSPYEGFTFTFTDGPKTTDWVRCAFVCGTNKGGAFLQLFLVSFGTTWILWYSDPLITNQSAFKIEISNFFDRARHFKFLKLHGKPKNKNLKILTYGGLQDAKWWEDSKSGLKIQIG